MLRAVPNRSRRGHRAFKEVGGVPNLLSSIAVTDGPLMFASIHHEFMIILAITKDKIQEWKE
jgi:hypothetical protein